MAKLWQIVVENKTGAEVHVPCLKKNKKVEQYQESDNRALVYFWNDLSSLNPSSLFFALFHLEMTV